MKTKQLLIGLSASAALALAVTPALAEKPEWAGQGKGHGKGKSKHFDNDRRTAIRSYYQEEYNRGFCPPGLAKKNNGCLPPGQAKKMYTVGQPLPPGVIVYDLPPALVLRMGTPPAGYKYVRVAADILMIAVGTSVVAEAIRDLGRI